jgi:hypothetical protein
LPAAVVDGFKRLTNREKTLAYIETEEIWKALPKQKLKSGKPGSSLTGQTPPSK